MHVEADYRQPTLPYYRRLRDPFARYLCTYCTMELPPMMSHSSGVKAERIVELGLVAIRSTTSEPARKRDLRDLGRRSHDLLRFVYGLDGDDEILNWTFTDAADDVNAVIWNLASGFYKAAASCARNALDLAFVSLYFNVRERTDPEPHAYNKFYSEWDQGNRDTPNWGECKTLLDQQPSVWAFNQQCEHGDVLALVQAHFHALSAFTHGRSFDKVSKAPTSGLWMGVNSPEFEVELFDRFSDLLKDTIGWIAVAWLVVFPEILRRDPLNAGNSTTPYAELLRHPVGRQAIQYAGNVKGI